MRILLIDDEAALCESMIELLYRHRHSVDYFRDSYDVYSLERIADSYDMAVIDLMMPPSYRLEGLALLKYIRKAAPKLPVVMISQKNERMTAVVNEAFQIGINGFLDKNDDDFLTQLLLAVKEIEQKMSNRIFISHGHNELLKLKLKDFVQNKLHREPLILSEMPNSGLTVVEKLEQAGGLCNQAIVLLTKDDEIKDGNMRARQNVIHEIGFFQGKYGRKNVILLCEHGVEIFSNISGIVRIEFSPDHFEEAYEDLRRELVKLK